LRIRDVDRSITLQAADQANVHLLGFDLTGSNWKLSGFDISTRTNGREGYGIHVSGSAAYDTIQNNYIHNFATRGSSWNGVSHISVLNNRIWRAEMAGAQVDAPTISSRATKSGVRSRSLSWQVNLFGMRDARRRRCGRLPVLWPAHVFRSNYLHDIYTALPTTRSTHDCFQTGAALR